MKGLRQRVDEPVSYRLPRARGRVLGRPDALVWPVLLAAAVLGAGVWWWAAGDPGRAVVSYVATMAVVVALFSVASLNVRMANRISPTMALVAAMFSYGATVLVTLIVYAALRPGDVDAGAVFAGSCVAVVVWMVGIVRASWVR